MPNPITPYSVNYGTLQAAVASGATLTIPYPAGATQATFADGSYAGTATLITNKNNVYSESTGQITVTYGASNITVTNTSGLPWSAGDLVDFGTGRAGYNYTFSGRQTPQAAVTDIATVKAALVKAGILY